MTSLPYFAHETACIDDGAEIGQGTKIWHFSHIMPDSIIGKNCNIGQNVVVSPKCQIGNNVKIHNNVYVSQNTTIEDDVFLAPGIVIANDPHPICTLCMQGPTIKRGARIGVNVTLLPRIVIGEYALIGAGSVVTKDVPARTLVVGNPAREVGDVDDLECPLGLVDKPYSEGRDVYSRKEKVSS